MRLSASGEDDAFCEAVCAADGLHVIAHHFCDEADRHHGATVAVDVRRGVHLIDGAVDGVVVVADGHGEHGVVEGGGDGADVAVVGDFCTEQFTDGAIWHVGAATLDDGGGVDLDGAAVDVDDIGADVKTHVLWFVFVLGERDHNGRVVWIEAQLQGAAGGEQAADAEACDAVGVGEGEHVGNGDVVGGGVDIDWHAFADGEPVVAQERELHVGSAGAAVDGDGGRQGLVAWIRNKEGIHADAADLGRDDHHGDVVCRGGVDGDGAITDGITTELVWPVVGDGVRIDGAGRHVERVQLIAAAGVQGEVEPL